MTCMLARHVGGGGLALLPELVEEAATGRSTDLVRTANRWPAGGQQARTELCKK